jgi:hypothetical protein
MTDRFCHTHAGTKPGQNGQNPGQEVLSRFVTRGLGQNLDHLFSIRQQSGWFCPSVIFVLKVFLTLKIIVLHAKYASGPKIVGQNRQNPKTGLGGFVSFVPRHRG